MKRHRLLVLTFFFLLMTGQTCNSAGIMNRSEPSNPDGNSVITGTISIKGNEPHTWVCLTTKAGEDFRLQGDQVQKIRTFYQHRLVSVKGSYLSPTQTGIWPRGFKVIELLAEP
jgi:hypothetical protein